MTNYPQGKGPLNLPHTITKGSQFSTGPFVLRHAKGIDLGDQQSGNKLHASIYLILTKFANLFHRKRTKSLAGSPTNRSNLKIYPCRYNVSLMIIQLVRQSSTYFPRQLTKFSSQI